MGGAIMLPPPPPPLLNVKPVLYIVCVCVCVFFVEGNVARQQ
jgi:hypothetical protein